MAQASKLDGFERRANSFFAHAIKLPHSQKKQWKPRTYTPKEDYGEPMQVDRLAPQDEEHRKKNRLCFNCGKPGHMSKDCKSPSVGHHEGQRENGQKRDTPPQRKKTFQGNRNGGKQKTQVRAIEAESSSDKAEQTRNTIRKIISESYDNQDSEDYHQFINQVNDMGF